MPLTNAPDLTQRPPRSARVRLGGYAVLPRMLDKGRATIAGKNGEFHYNCPLDQHILNFLGVDPEALKKELETGKGDGDIFEWIEKNAKNKHSLVEIQAWSDFMDKRAPADVESRAYFNELHTKLAPKLENVVSWGDLLDIDDYVSFGGKV
ncbi:MAG TPA: DUF5069 domain-containing protein [Verrucomicrobiae bacterium]|jgi:hypothetical protein|nr:DUF5069 domain-containing protein [Verrucomicrobiae bacterium]